MTFITGRFNTLESAWKHASSQSTNNSPASSAADDKALDSAWQDQRKKALETNEDKAYNQVENDIDLKVVFNNASKWPKSAL